MGYYILSILFSFLVTLGFSGFLKYHLNNNPLVSRWIALQLDELMSPNGISIFASCFIPFYNIFLSIALLLAIGFRDTFFEMLHEICLEQEL